MRAINFDAKFVDQIIDGRKRTTVRKGIKVFRRGEVVELTSDGKTFGRAKIVKVLVKRVSELSDGDAELDGFPSKDELLRELERIYGDVRGEDLISIIHFEVL